MSSVKRYFKIMLSVLFIFQTSAFAGNEKVNSFDVSAYKNYKFSDLFLTENEISRLNDEERTIYMISIIQLASVIEVSQNFYVGLHDRDDVSSIQSKDFEDVAKQTERFKISTPEKLKALSRIFTGERAEAVVGLAARFLWSAKSSVSSAFTASKAATSKLSSSGMSWLEKKAVERAAQVEINAVKKGKDAVAAAKKANSNDGLSRKAIDAEIKRIKNSGELTTLSKKMVDAEKKYASLSDELAAAKKAPTPDKAKIANLQKQMKTIETQQAKDYAKYDKLGGSRVELNQLAARQFRSTGEKAFAVAGAGVLGYQVGEIAVNAYNSTGMADSARTVVEKVKSHRNSKHKAINGEIVGEEVTDAIKREEGYGCLFGGYPSKLVNFSGEIKCTEPKQFSSTPSCSKAGKFKCNNYGLTEDGQGLDKELCINKGPLDSLTLRCSVKLAEIHERAKGQLVQNSEEWMSYQNKVKEIVQKMEATPFMQDSEGRVRTIGSYCQTTNDLQKLECEAVTTLLKQLGGNGHFQASEVRAAAAAQAEIDAKVEGRSGPGPMPAMDTGASVPPAQSAPQRPPTETREAGANK